METRPTLLITLTGRDRPGVTSRLFTVLARFPLSVVDIEQVVIRGRLVLGVLLVLRRAARPDRHPPLGHRAWPPTSAWTRRSPPARPSRRQRRRSGAAAEQLHVTVLGSPLQPDAVAAIAGRIAASGANIDRIDRLASDR